VDANAGIYDLARCCCCCCGEEDCTIKAALGAVMHQVVAIRRRRLLESIMIRIYDQDDGDNESKVESRLSNHAVVKKNSELPMSVNAGEWIGKRTLTQTREKINLSQNSRRMAIVNDADKNKYKTQTRCLRISILSNVNDRDLKVVLCCGRVVGLYKMVANTFSFHQKRHHE
jgi:hypothetical protein